MARYGWLITVVGLVVVLSMSSQLAQAQSDKNQLQSDLDTANADLADIQAVFPPRNFSSSTELEDWLQSNSISLQPPATTYEEWYSKALQRQADALADGFIISVDYDYFFDDVNEYFSVWNIAVIDGIIWFWDPETDIPLEDNLLEPLG
jgi:hypothetical protein